MTLNDSSPRSIFFRNKEIICPLFLGKHPIFRQYYRDDVVSDQKYAEPRSTFNQKHHHSERYFSNRFTVLSNSSFILLHNFYLGRLIDLVQLFLNVFITFWKQCVDYPIKNRQIHALHCREGLIYMLIYNDSYYKVSLMDFG